MWRERWGRCFSLFLDGSWDQYRILVLCTPPSLSGWPWRALHFFEVDHRCQFLPGSEITYPSTGCCSMEFLNSMIGNPWEVLRYLAIKSNVIVIQKLQMTWISNLILFCKGDLLILYWFICIFSIILLMIIIIIQLGWWVLLHSYFNWAFILLLSMLMSLILRAKQLEQSNRVPHSFFSLFK